MVTNLRQKMNQKVHVIAVSFHSMAKITFNQKDFTYTSCLSLKKIFPLFCNFVFMVKFQYIFVGMIVRA